MFLGIGGIALLWLLSRRPSFLSKETYYDKVYGAWIGQITGHHLVRHLEGRWVHDPGPMDTIYYGLSWGGYEPRLVTGICEPDNYENCYVNSRTDDDANIDRLNLYIFETHGLNPDYEQIRQAWGDKLGLLYFANRFASCLMDGTCVPQGLPYTGPGQYDFTPSGNTCPAVGCMLIEQELMA